MKGKRGLLAKLKNIDLFYLYMLNRQLDKLKNKLKYEKEKKNELVDFQAKGSYFWLLIILKANL